jgi:hypothetical protein
MTRDAVFSCLGLGDGLIALVLSNNLHLNGGEVTTFHPFLGELQPGFPHLPLRKFPPPEEMDSLLSGYDRFFIILEKSPWMQAILAHCQQHYPERTTVLNPIATGNRDYPFWEQGRFDGTRSFVENLYTFCQDVLKFTVVTKSNGIVVPEGIKPRKFEKRVIIHPTSSREGKNWPREKYIQLALELQRRDFSPSFLLTLEERRYWDLEKLDTPLFSTHMEMAAFVSESGYMIGNDSGIGHLASCLGLPTVTICRSAQNARFWRPGWSLGKVIAPSPWIPNLKGFRLRDRYWKKWISVGNVVDQFNHLVEATPPLQKFQD